MLLVWDPTLLRSPTFCTTCLFNFHNLGLFWSLFYTPFTNLRRQLPFMLDWIGKPFCGPRNIDANKGLPLKRDKVLKSTWIILWKFLNVLQRLPFSSHAVMIQLSALNTYFEYRIQNSQYRIALNLCFIFFIIIVIIIYEFLVRLLQSEHRCITWVQ